MVRNLLSCTFTLEYSNRTMFKFLVHIIIIATQGWLIHLSVTDNLGRLKDLFLKIFYGNYILFTKFIFFLCKIVCDIMNNRKKTYVFRLDSLRYKKGLTFWWKFFLYLTSLVLNSRFLNLTHDGEGFVKKFDIVSKGHNRVLGIKNIFTVTDPDLPQT